MKQKINTDIAILGGGASGIIAAISAAHQFKKLNTPYNIIILEKNARIGKKILITGNGKCNLTNQNIAIQNYNLSSRAFIKNILPQYNCDFVVSLFKKWGLLTRADSMGRIYPYSNQSASVVDILMNELIRLKINIHCNFNATSIVKNNNEFYLESSEIVIKAKKLIIACGGKASPFNTPCRDAYKYLSNFGHTITFLYPALVPIQTNSGFEKSLKGIRAPGVVNLIADDNLVLSELGEIQFTEYGLSGICIFQISSLVGEFLHFKTINNKPIEKILISIDLMPEFSEYDIIKLLKNKIKNFPGNSVENLLTGILNKKVGQVILKKSSITNLSLKRSSLSEKHLTIIAKNVKNFSFIPTDILPFKNAQVTCGGAVLEEFNCDTLESKKVHDFYSCGEILNVNGDCGGYNLHWAWVSGFIAGKSAASSCTQIKNKRSKK